MRVLLVEDTDDLRRLFARLLRLAGFEVLEVANGREALDCSPVFGPHLVLTDLMMPVVGGVELIRRLRLMPAMVGVPIIAMTAAATAATGRDALKAGAAELLTKPLDSGTLLDRIGVYRGRAGLGESRGLDLDIRPPGEDVIVPGLPVGFAAGPEVSRDVGTSLGLTPGEELGADLGNGPVD